MKIILSGGGTGGHVNPALAIGSAVLAREPASELHYVGTPAGIENKLVPENYKMHHIEIRGLKRNLSPENLKTAFMTVTSVLKSRKLLKELKPDAVIGTGGYVCFPICAAAASMHIPCFLHESNAVPGFAVKMLEKKADVIFVNFAQTADLLKRAKKVVHVGTPLRERFYTLDKDSARRELKIEQRYTKVVLSFGGSLGAVTLNREILEMMRAFGKNHPNVLFLHAAGGRGYEEFRREFEKQGLSAYDNLRFYEYIYDMPTHMAAADLVICRSGAMTLSELAVLGKPSILIPSPNVTNDQQTKNAVLLSEMGAALMIRENELEKGKLTDAVEALLLDRKSLEQMSEKVKTFAVRNAENAVYENIAQVVTQRKAKR